MKIDKNKKQAGVRKKSEQKIISPVREILEKNPPEIIQKIKAIIYQALQESFPEVIIGENAVNIEHPKLNNYGDFSTNIGMIMAGRLKMKPMDAAEKLSRKIEEYIKEHQLISIIAGSADSKKINFRVDDVLENVNFVLPGFVNLYFTKNWFISQMNRLPDIDQTAKSGKTVKNEANEKYLPLKGLKVSVEYTDPNPFKEFHLGHIYSNVIGESIARLFEENGATVWRADFYGDAGMHIAKSVWGMLEHMKDKNFTIHDLEQLPIKQRQRFLGEGYALGVRRYEEDKQTAEEIKDINYSVYVAAQENIKKMKGWKPIINYRQYIQGKEDQFEKIQEVYEAGLSWSLEYFESIYKRLGTKFDGYYPESWVGELGMKIVEKGLKTGVMEKSDGAVVFKGEKEGLHTRVFVNKLGLPTYEAKDLGLALAKYQDFKYDMSINIFGKEIDEYYYVVKAAMLKIDPELGKKAFHLAHGMVKLPEGKMSSRTGNVITFEWLSEEVKRKVLEVMKGISLTSNEKETVADRVGLGAVRYALLRSNIGADVIFDFNKSVTFEGDSGPYIMYTYARCKSVLRKAEEQGQPLHILSYQSLQGLPLQNEEMELLREFYKFEEVVWEAGKNLAPNFICSYLYDLAQKFNLFYQKHTILGNRSQEVGISSKIINFRLELTEATAAILKKGLYLLGIETVERM